MRWAVLVLMACVLLAVVDGDVMAKSRGKTAKAKAVDANSTAAKKPAAMNDQQVKEAQKKIEQFQGEAIKRQEELLKELYSLRAVAIKEHADETQNTIDEIVAKEKERLDTLVKIAPMKTPPVDVAAVPEKEPNQSKKVKAKKR